MITEFGDDNAGAAGKIFGDTQRQIVRFAARAGEHYLAQLSGHGAHQFFGEVQDIFMQITGVRVQRGCLTHQRFQHMRMAMANGRHVVVDVEITAAISVIHPHAFAAHQMHWILVEQLVSRAQQTTAAFYHRQIVG
ncbi:hypothetical protein SRABI106_03429 [Rahnella aquatilis]|nr:hypothetical protein SRABI106_03429 [Rahnella aquatilis]